MSPNIYLSMAALVLEYIWFDDFVRNNGLVSSGYLFPDDCTRLIWNSLNQDLGSPRHSDLCQALQWSYDGSSTGQAHGDNSEIILVPVYLCVNAWMNHRYHSDCYYLVLCQTLTADMQPTPNNHYHGLQTLLQPAHRLGAYFGFEQEFFLMQTQTGNPTMVSSCPVGMPMLTGECNHQSLQQYYCGVGAENIDATARQLVEQVYHYGLLSGLKLSGNNAEVAIGHWSVGDPSGTDSGGRGLPSIMDPAVSIDTFG